MIFSQGWQHIYSYLDIKPYKSAEKSRLTDKHVQLILKITTAGEIQLNFKDFINEKCCFYKNMM